MKLDELRAKLAAGVEPRRTVVGGSATIVEDGVPYRLGHAWRLRYTAERFDELSVARELLRVAKWRCHNPHLVRVSSGVEATLETGLIVDIDVWNDVLANRKVAECPLLQDLIAPFAAWPECPAGGKAPLPEGMEPEWEAALCELMTKRRGWPPVRVQHLRTWCYRDDLDRSVMRVRIVEQLFDGGTIPRRTWVEVNRRRSALRASDYVVRVSAGQFGTL